MLAHPGQYKADNVMEMMIEEHMLDGIELNHPRNDEKTREHITSLCKEHDLFMTGGTAVSYTHLTLPTTSRV